MKNLQMMLAILAFAFLAPVSLSAATSVSAQESREILVKKIVSQKSIAFADKVSASKMMKKAARFAKFFGVGEKVDFQSEPDKWLWFGIFGLGIGFILYTMGWFLVAPFWYLGYLCWMAGVVCLIVWFLKKQGAI